MPTSHASRLWLAALSLGLAATVFAADRAPVADAAEQADLAALRRHIQQRADVNAAQVDGMTALHWAAQRGDVAMAKALLRAKADAGATNRYGVTPLSLACQAGSTPMVELLLDHGANANTALRGGETVLMTAARAGRPEAVSALIRRGADVNATERRGQTALMWAAAEGHVEVVQVLLKAGADPRATLPDSGFTPMLFAVREGRPEVVRALLKAGVGVNDATDPRKPGGKTPAKGTSALTLAVENGHLELAIELIEAGADPNDQRSGYTPLHMMSWVRKPPRGEDNGAPPPTGTGRLGTLQFVRELVKHGADVNARLKTGRGGLGLYNKMGATPFFMASATADVPFMQLLVELGADPSIKNADNCTPLIAACGIHVGSDQATEVAGEEPEVLQAAELLLKLGADIDAVDANGETPMHAAALKNLPKVIQFLADHGARPEVWNRPNKSGWTPLMIGEGHRPGNFKPSVETVAAVQKVMRAAGLPIPVAETPTVRRNSDWEPLPAKKK